MDVKNWRHLNCLCVIILVCSQNAMANEDDYLSLLEAEAADSRLDSGKSLDNRGAQKGAVINTADKNWSGECGVVGKALSPNIPREEFFSYLEQCSMMTFSLYRKLDSHLQLSIYDSYSKAESVTARTLRKEILKIY